MKWLLIFAGLLGVYFWLLISTTDTMIDQTIRLQQRYQTVAAEADRIAAGQQ